MSDPLPLPVEVVLRLVVPFDFDGARDRYAEEQGFEPFPRETVTLYDQELTPAVGEFLALKNESGRAPGIGVQGYRFRGRTDGKRVRRDGEPDRDAADFRTVELYARGKLPFGSKGDSDEPIANRIGRIWIDPKIGIELFLSSEGTGVLSVALRVDDFRSLDDLAWLVYSATNLTDPERSAQLFHSKSAERIEAWFALSPNARRAYAPHADGSGWPVPQVAKTIDALGKPDRVLPFQQFVRNLIGQDAKLLLHRAQHFLVATFPPGTLVVGPDIDRRREILRLAQAEEPTHAGWIEGVDAPRPLALNATHLLCNAHYGTVHFLVHEVVEIDGVDSEGRPKTKPKSFNKVRTERVATKYFVPFLVALFQRHLMEGLVARAARDLGQRSVPGLALTGDEPIAEPREDLVAAQRLQLDFTRVLTGANFLLLSEREAVQRYYETCVEAQRVPEVIRDARQSISEVEGFLRGTHQSETLRALQVTAKAGERLQHLGHRFEILIIGVYAVEVGHLVYEQAHERALFGTIALTTLGIFGFSVAFGMQLGTERSGHRWSQFRKEFLLPVIASLFLIAFAVASWTLSAGTTQDHGPATPSPEPGQTTPQR